MFLLARALSLSLHYGVNFLISLHKQVHPPYLRARRGQLIPQKHMVQKRIHRRSKPTRVE